MTRCQYTSEFKSKVVLNIFQGNQELNGIMERNFLQDCFRKKEQLLQEKPMGGVDYWHILESCGYEPLGSSSLD